MNYSIERPKLPVTVYLLTAVIVIGLIALGMAAFTAFSKVASPWQAFFSAAVVEISAIVEALALVRGKNWIGLGGMTASLAVSGTYNYIQAKAEGAKHGLTGWWELGTLALGPLLALAFLSLTLGKEIREHEKRVTTWQEDAKKWAADQQAKLKAEEERREKERKDAQERERQERQQADEREKVYQYQMERLRQEAEIKKAQAIAEEERKAEIARARIEAKQNTRQDADLQTERSGNFPKSSDWRNLPAEDKSIIASMSTSEIVQRYGVSDRTARNWRAAASANGHSNGTSKAG